MVETVLVTCRPGFLDEPGRLPKTILNVIGNGLLGCSEPASVPPQGEVPPPAPAPNTSTAGQTHVVHIRNVPLEIWSKARLNALLSNLPVKRYLIRLIVASQPFPPPPTTG